MNGFLPFDFSPLGGSTAVHPHNFKDAGFKEYMKALLLNDINKQHLPEWWSEIRALRNCSAHDGQHSIVYSVASALKCITQDSTTRFVLEYIALAVNFIEITGKRVFDEFGERRSAIYGIINFQQDEKVDAI